MQRSEITQHIVKGSVRFRFGFRLIFDLLMFSAIVPSFNWVCEYVHVGHSSKIVTLMQLSIGKQMVCVSGKKNCVGSGSSFFLFTYFG